MNGSKEQRMKGTFLSSLISSHPSSSPSFLRRNLLPVLMFAAFAAAVTSYIILTDSREALGMKPRHVWRLMYINLGLLVAVIAFVGWRILRMWRTLKAESGSRLQKRILVLFSVVAIVPTIIVSVFSALFFNFGIQTWFNDRVQTAVTESLAVAEAYLSEHKENIRADAIAMANDLNQVAPLALTNPLEFNRIVATQSALRVLTEAIVFQRNRIVAQGRLSFALAFEHIPNDVLERAARGEAVLMTTDDDKVRALVKIDGMEDGFLLVGRLIDSKVLNHMESTQGAVNEYSSLKSQLDRLQVVFSVVFVTLAALLLLSSVGYGMIFAARLTRPISGLVAAAERVRGGDFGTRVEESAEKDEIATLGRAFNRMTEQLAAQRSGLIDANRRLDERRRFSEAVLSGVSAGVIALDRDKRVTLSNRSAASILGVGEITPGTGIADLLPGIGELLAKAEHITAEVTQGTLAVNGNNRALTLHARVTVEKLGEEIEGFIVTFDDITLLVAAQRNAAWSDVARRVAHEIKNPLTPIQLATERLKRKYLQFVGDDQENFVKYTDTISKHAADIGRMVEEFVSFARMPTPVFADEDLGALLKKAVFSAQVANPGIEYRLELPNSPLMLHCDERQIGQVMTNLLKNAAEAIEAKEEAAGVVAVELACDNGRVMVSVEDNGIGFPLGEMQKMLEPYVTTRSKGTGLGLSIVKKIVEDHKGLINIGNSPSGGARVVLSFLQQCDIKAAS